MKRVNFILAIILLIITGCGKQKQITDDLITVDVTKSYPKKKNILQDFMYVEYIPLETTENFLCQGYVLTVGRNIILVRNENRDGDIFIFDRTGKGLRKINHMGGGNEEYSFILGITLDENNDEIFVSDPSGKILVYDLFGKFKRKFNYTEDGVYDKIYDFDKENLICDFRDKEGRRLLNVISKKDGNIIKNIKIPVKQMKLPMMTIPRGEISVSMVYKYNSIIPHQNNWIYTESSSDTIFRFLPDLSMSPFIVRTPSIQSMNLEIFLFPIILTERYYFMESMKKEMDDSNSGFPKTQLMYDIQEKEIFEYAFYNDDFSVEKPITTIRAAINNEIAFLQKFEAYQLVESYKNGELKDGKLKEIASKLNEEDNPVIMLVKYKK